MEYLSRKGKPGAVAVPAIEFSAGLGMEGRFSQYGHIDLAYTGRHADGAYGFGARVTFAFYGDGCIGVAEGKF